jgi:hypothetical protein
VPNLLEKIVPRGVRWFFFFFPMPVVFPFEIRVVKPCLVQQFLELLLIFLPPRKLGSFVRRINSSC